MVVAPSSALQDVALEQLSSGAHQSTGGHLQVVVREGLGNTAAFAGHMQVEHADPSVMDRLLYSCNSCAVMGKHTLKSGILMDAYGDRHNANCSGNDVADFVGYEQLDGQLDLAEVQSVDVAVVGADGPWADCLERSAAELCRWQLDVQHQTCLYRT